MYIYIYIYIYIYTRCAVQWRMLLGMPEQGLLSEHMHMQQDSGRHRCRPWRMQARGHFLQCITSMTLCPSLFQRAARLNTCSPSSNH